MKNKYTWMWNVIVVLVVVVSAASCVVSAFGNEPHGIPPGGMFHSHPNGFSPIPAGSSTEYMGSPNTTMPDDTRLSLDITPRKVIKGETIIPAALSSASFTDTYNDYGIDTDGNGLYDYLVIEAEIAVTKGGKYEFRDELYYYNEFTGCWDYGVACHNHNYSYLNPGLHNLTLKLNGIELRALKYYGTFKIGLYLAEEIKDEWTLIDEAEYYTGSYDYTGFERLPAEFAPGFNDYGRDTDGNSLFDYLVIEKAITVRKAGNYELSGSIESPSGERIDSDDNKTYLEAGMQSITLLFYGPSIYNAGESGNFVVAMDLEETEDRIKLDSTTNTTSYYSCTEFERPPAEFAPGFNDYGLDIDGDSLYDYLVIEKAITVIKAGNYRLSGRLESPSGERIDSDDNKTYLEAGMQSITLLFYGHDIYSAGETGSFVVDMYLYDADDGRRLNSTTNTTAYYSCTEFQRTPAEFASGFNDYGLDTDGDSLFDYLVIEKAITVREAGNYRLSGRLESLSGGEIDSIYNYTYLEAGMQSITLLFYGPYIYNKGENVSFVVDMDLYDTDNRRGLDSTTNTTSYYSYTEFQRLPVEFAPGFNDYGLDTDGNSLFDYLVIEKAITVRKAGNYRLSGSLESPFGELIDYAGNNTYLEVGMQSITLLFYGLDIYSAGENVSFVVDMHLYDADDRRWLDSTTNTTAYYSYTGFQRPPAEFAPGFNDYGWDTDGDSLFDYLVIEKAITVREAGNYTLSSSLESPSGDWIDYDYNNTYLEVGMQSITLLFYGLDIYSAGENGSFIVDMDLYDIDNRRRLDSTTDTTSYYNYTKFQRLPAEFASGFNDYGLDTDGNSLFDYLVIEKAITVRKAGNYTLSGRLRSPSGELIDYDYNNTYLEAGMQSITLQLYGLDIYIAGENGSFVVNMKLYDTEDMSWFDSTTDTTSYYSYTEFERLPAEFAPGFNDYGLDTDGNSLYDYLVIEKEIEVKKAGNYRLSGSLESPSGDRIDSDDNKTYLEAGLRRITLQFYGLDIYNARENGSFVVDMHLCDDDWRRLDSATNKTAYYRYTEFEGPHAEFAPGFNDYGWDTDGDSLFDYLVIEKAITVRKAGNYTLSGRLEPPSGGGIDSTYNNTYLEAGMQSITLLFYGPDIYNAGENVSFVVDMDLYDTDDWGRLDSTTNTTSYYSYTEFQRPPAEFAPGFSDYGLDTDGNLLYNYLVIEKAITVRKAGNYRLSGRLESPSGGGIDSAYNNTYLEAGLRRITLLFYGLDIYNAGKTGNFVVDMNLYDTDDGGRLDSTTNTTAYYRYTEFEGPHAEFAPGFNDYGWDTDGDSLFDYLVIEKAITVRKAGNYTLSSSLESPSGDWIDYDYNNTYLDVGMQSIKFLFYGPYIYNKGENGSFVVDTDLYDIDDGRWLDLTTNKTAYYNCTEFERSPAEFAPGFNDYGWDTDGNSLFDYLVIEKAITVREAGNYKLSGRLKSPSGERIDSAYNNTYLEAGVQSIKLLFYGPYIYNKGENGSFVVDMDLEETEDGEDLDSTTKKTAYYNCTEFDRPSAEFASGFSDYGLDTDGDSLYDYLVTKKAITIREAGTYRLSGRLESPSGERIDSDYNKTYLDVGLQSIKLQFYGPYIYNAGENGSFVVDMDLEETKDREDLDSTTKKTAYYNCTEFDRPSAEFAPGFSDYGRDTDGNSLYDYLVIEKAITVREAGNYRLSGRLESPSGERIDSDDNKTYLEAGLQSIKLQFYWLDIYSAGENGSFVVDMDLYDTDDGRRLDSTTDTTSYYSYTEFQRPPAEFAPGLNDYGMDTDGNSLYDYLVIEKAITVREAGNYRLSGRLESPFGERIDYDENNTYLEAGLQSITLQFYGLDIYSTGENVSFVVDMYLYDTDDGGRLDSTTDTTSYYSYTEFERPPAAFTGNFNDYGLDTDGDGLYNYIAVEAEMNVKKAGEYKFYCALRTSSGDRIDSDRNITYLDVGIHSITSMLSGHKIYDHGYTGSFRAVFELHVAEAQTEIDEAEYLTADYHYTDFDPVIPPAIVSVTAAPNAGINKDNPAMIHATISGDYLSGMMLFAGEKVESTEATTIYELRLYERIPPDEWLFAGSNTYTISAQWNATTIGTYVEETYIGCYHAADGVNESYPLIEELPGRYIGNEFNRTVYYTKLGSFFHNGTWHDASIWYFPDTENVELVYVSRDMVFLNTTDPKLIAEYPNAKSLNPDSQCTFMNHLIVTDANGTIIADPFDDEETRASEAFRIGALMIKKNTPLPAGEYVIGVNVEDEAGNRAIKGATVFVSGTAQIFDTGPGAYPSISGTHNGTIIPAYDLNVSMVYTYPCSGTGGHTESIELYENGERSAYGTWNGYAGDWHNVTMQNARGAPYVVLLAGHEYDYVIRTGSYPQIIHRQVHQTPDGGVITCDTFIDVNGKRYNDWIPAIAFF